MTEKIKDAQEVLQVLTFTVARKEEMPKDIFTINIVLDALNVAIQTIEEIQQYRALGSVEECKEAKEKQIPKELLENGRNPVYIENTDTVSGLCPVCLIEFNCIIPRYYKANGYGYCRKCGQKLDWGEESE